MNISEASKKFGLSRALISRLCSSGEVPGAHKVPQNGTLCWELPDNIVIRRAVDRSSSARVFVPHQKKECDITQQDRMDAFVWIHQHNMTVADLMERFHVTNDEIMDSLQRGLDRQNAGIDPMFALKKNVHKSPL